MMKFIRFVQAVIMLFALFYACMSEARAGGFDLGFIIVLGLFAIQLNILHYLWKSPD